MDVVAHGLGGVRDLPVPTWMFYWGGALVLVLSFVLLGALWRRPLLASKARGRRVPGAVERALQWPPVVLLVRALSVAMFFLVFAAALLGDQDPFENLAPTWIYVMFWLGIPLLSVLFGDVWRVLSPWLALADAFVWAWERTGRVAGPLSTYPERVGRWPAATLLFAFVALELAYTDPASPRALAFATALYTYVTLFGYIAFGRATWQERGEGFAVAFAYLARVAPVSVRAGRHFLRWPTTGLHGTERIPGSLAVLAVMLGSVAFDGLSRTSWWQNVLADVEGPFLVDDPGLADLLVMLANLGGLTATVLFVAGAYLGTCAVMRSTVDAPRSLVPDFILSLVPIALVYAVAHYFSLFVIQGQFTIPLLSDPLGRDWDLLGTADYLPNLVPFSPSTVWYVQAGALVAGHVVGLAVAHDRAVTIFDDRRDALRSQFPMLALMVVYTVGGLWLLSRG
jgi:hypothetical protein